MTTPNNRLYRAVPPEFFPTDNIIASLDRARNIVFFRQDVFDTLPYSEKRKIYYLDSPYLEMTAPTKSPVDLIWQ